jgi:hypothetical protein
MKRMISMFLILTSLFMLCTISVSAASGEDYVSEVALIYEDSAEDALEEIEGTGWKLFEYDLNPDADATFDDGVYLIYKTSTNVEDAITDLRVMDMYGGYSTTNYESQLEESRNQYKQAVADLRVATEEFKTLYIAGDEMAKLAYRQMNYYKDVGGTEMLMGDFFLGMPTDENKIVQVFMEGNTFIVLNLVSLIAVGISGASGNTLATRIAENYAIKDTLTDTEYYKSAETLASEFAAVKAKLLRYDTVKEEYDLEDEDMPEEEFSFLTEYAAMADLLTTIPLGEKTLAEFIRGEWEIKDLYPIVASFTAGQMALIEMGQLETVLKYNSPSKPVEELNRSVDELEETLKDENGNLKVFDVYQGVDREIFKGNFAMTSAAERQQAITGETWDFGSAASRSLGVSIAYIAASVLDLALMGTSIGISVKASALESAYVIGEKIMQAGGLSAEEYYAVKAAHDKAFAIHAKFVDKWAGVGSNAAYASVALTVVILGCYGISTWYNYYNPDYLVIPNTLVDVVESDLGDKYVKYTAAKVYEDEELTEKNADFNAYEGKEWIALYYTKDATAGKCLTPKFVYKDNDSTIARRHQGISMFGESEAFNLNSHVYDSDAPGVYVTVRYSTAKKAAADIPTVVGSMFSGGAFYVLTAFGGAAVGAGATFAVGALKKKKETADAGEADAQTEI